MHPGHTVEEVIENTGFDFDRPGVVPWQTVEILSFFLAFGAALWVNSHPAGPWLAATASGTPAGSYAA